LHLLFYKPQSLFRVQHRLLSRLALWLFGGQVFTAGPEDGKGKTTSAPKAGSTLVVFSPYLVPLYTILLCLVMGAVRLWWDVGVAEAPAAFLIGSSLAFHWVMTADDLQRDRSRFPLELYLIALAIIGLISLVLISLCLPLAVPELSLAGVFAEALAQTWTIYTSAIRILFF
jgi:hypothetical protein